MVTTTLAAFTPAGRAFVPLIYGWEHVKACGEGFQPCMAVVHKSALCLHCGQSRATGEPTGARCPAACPRADWQRHRYIYQYGSLGAYRVVEGDRAATVWHEPLMQGSKWRVTWSAYLPSHAAMTTQGHWQHGISTYATPFGRWTHLQHALDMANAWVAYGLLPFDPATGAAGAWAADRTDRRET